MTLITQDNSIGWYKKYPWICENCYEFHKGNRWHCEVCKADICPKCSSADASLLQNSKDENKSGNNDDSDELSSNIRKFNQSNNLRNIINKSIEEDKTFTILSFHFKIPHKKLS